MASQTASESGSGNELEKARFMIRGNIIYCDCCGSEKLAQVVGDSLVIKDRRHGDRHVAVVKISELLDILENKSDNSTKDQAAVAAKT